MRTFEDVGIRVPVRGEASRPTLVTFVVPVFNESECIRELYERTRGSARACAVRYEIIFVNDRSTDGTLALLKELHTRDGNVKVITLSRNFGHQVAITAGLRHARGDCVLVMDGDLQDPPELLSGMLELWRRGNRVVFGVRRKRKEPWFKKCCYFLFYRILSKFSSLPIPQDAGDFCLMDRRVVEELKKLREDRPFLRGLRSWVGFRQAGIEYDRPGRVRGRTKYSLSKLLKLAFDGWLSFSDIFLRLSTILGLAISMVSFTYGMYIIVSILLARMGVIEIHHVPSGWTSLACFITFLFGIQFIFMGILAEYIGRIFVQVKQRPAYIADELVGIHEESDIDQCCNTSP